MKGTLACLCAFALFAGCGDGNQTSQNRVNRSGTGPDGAPPPAPPTIGQNGLTEETRDYTHSERPFTKTLKIGLLVSPGSEGAKQEKLTFLIYGTSEPVSPDPHILPHGKLLQTLENPGSTHVVIPDGVKGLYYLYAKAQNEAGTLSAPSNFVTITIGKTPTGQGPAGGKPKPLKKSPQLPPAGEVPPGSATAKEVHLIGTAEFRTHPSMNLVDDDHSNVLARYEGRSVTLWFGDKLDSVIPNEPSGKAIRMELPERSCAEEVVATYKTAVGREEAGAILRSMRAKTCKE
jgi:hypothetical protein